jgi:hypothetical protein
LAFFNVSCLPKFRSTINYLQGINLASNKMKSTWAWRDGGKGNNVSGFNGLPGGTVSAVEHYSTLASSVSGGVLRITIQAMPGSETCVTVMAM